MIFFHLLLISLLTTPLLSFSQTNNPFEKEAKLLITTLQKKHYTPKPLNDQFSNDLFEDFLLNLDQNTIYFREADIKTIQGYRTLLDKELSGSSWGFLPKTTALYKQRLEACEILFSQILDKPFDYKSSEFISLSLKDSFDFAKDEQSYLKRCTRYLKYQTLKRLILTSSKEKSNEEILKNEASARAQVKTIVTRKIRRILEHPMGFENYVASTFFNCIATSFDPHTAYFHKTSFENFKSHLSKEGYSLGIELDENEEGEVEVKSLVPGGPAWKSNEIHQGDILLSLKWNLKKEVDLTGATSDEVEELLSQSNTEKIQLSFRKTSGLITTVELRKEKLESDENIVKSYILKGEKK